jgi:hypothetical protein
MFVTRIIHHRRKQEPRMKANTSHRFLNVSDASAQVLRNRFLSNS